MALKKNTNASENQLQGILEPPLDQDLKTKINTQNEPFLNTKTYGELLKP